MFLRYIIVILFEKEIEGKMLGVILQLFGQEFPTGLEGSTEPHSRTWSCSFWC